MEYKPIYTLIIHQVRINAKISLTEYCVADIITKLMGNPESKFPGWYYGDQDYLAKIIGVSTKTIQRAYKELLKKNFIEKDQESDFIRTTAIWYKKAYLEKGQSVHSVDKMSSKGGQNVLQGEDKMSYYNNIYNKHNIIERAQHSQEKQKKISPAKQAKEFFNNQNYQNIVMKWLVKKGMPEDLARKELNNFVSYWTELNKSGTKQRWELQQAFELKRRLTTWFKNSKEWSSKKQFNKNSTLVI